MYPMNIAKTVRLINDTCLNIKEGNKILIIGYTDEDFKLASALAADAHAVKAEVGIILVEPPYGKVEPPEFLFEAMKKVDLIITLDQVDFGHTAARKELTEKAISYAYIPDLMNQELTELNIQPQDLLDVEGRTNKIAQLVTNASQARISSSAGTNLEMSIQDRSGIAIQPIFRQPGHFAIVPFYCEVACAPVEDTANGTVVSEGTVVGLPGLNGVLHDPIQWEVEKGRIVDIKGGKEARLLTELLPTLGENADRIAELGIGTNYKMRNVLVGNRRDNAVWGHIHIALGRNTDLGGNQWSPIHSDFLSMNTDLELDGKQIIKNGQLLV